MAAAPKRATAYGRCHGNPQQRQAHAPAVTAAPRARLRNRSACRGDGTMVQARLVGRV